MITRIEVDGFKSLKEFHLDFAYGLNLLVGPNGSGKTNIVSFFEFLAHLMEMDASEATTYAGGAGAVFRRIAHAYERKIRARILGCVATRPGESSSERPFCAYDYQFSLIFPESGDTILYETQRMRLRREAQFVEAKDFDDQIKWGLDIESNYQPDGTTRVKTHSLEDAQLTLPFYTRRRRPSRSKERPEALEEVLGQILTGGNLSLVPLVSRYTPNLWSIARDLSGGQIYNIVPSRLKMPEDSSKPPGIGRDGSGLAATLYALQRGRAPSELYPWPYFRRTRAGGQVPIRKHLTS